LTAKAWFIERFNGELIYEVPEKLNFPLSSVAKKQRWFDFITTLDHTYQAWHLIQFLHDQGSEALYENKVLKACKGLNDEDIPVGMKLIKAFKFFITDPCILDEIQTIASRIVQEDRVEGKLCFSVHPLDFLSLSENTYNWRSCHALDGEYRCGNLSYMTDKITMICYLKGDHEDQILPRFGNVKWNSKKWRMLLFFNDDTYDAWFAGRQYPFPCHEALDTVREIFVRDILKLNLSHWSYWHDDIIERIPYAEHDYADNLFLTPLRNIGGQLYKLEDIVSDGKHAQQFNDLLRSSCYQPYYGWRKYYGSTSPGYIHFTVGAAAPCIACGEKPIVTGDSMFCKECELKYGHSEDEDLFVYCEHCGQRIYVEDAYYDEYINGYGGYLCEDCWDTRKEE
jgi:hypothetical protein